MCETTCSLFMDVATCVQCIDNTVILAVILKVLNFHNETNVVLQDVSTFFGKISASKCYFGTICGL